MGNPYGGHKPHKLRNPKVVVVFHVGSGKMKVLNCIKFDALKNEKGQISDYVATAKEAGDWLTASIFPAKYWCTKEEWEKRPKAPKAERAEPQKGEQLPAEPAVIVAPATTAPAPPAPAPPPTDPSPLTFTGIEDEEISEAEVAALAAPRVVQKPLALDVELPGEYNPKAHMKDKFALGKPEDLVTFDANVQKNLIDQEAQRRIAMARHRGEMNKKLMAERAGFMPDGG